jgi:hypothetical protein
MSALFDPLVGGASFSRWLNVQVFDDAKGSPRVRFVHRSWGRESQFSLSFDQVEELFDVVCELVARRRQGRIIDGVAWCARCGSQPVNVEAGEDTCGECLRNA